MFQYNDTADKADITAYNINSTKWRVYDFTDFEWQDITTWSFNNLIVMKVKSSGEVMDAAFYNESLVLQVNTYIQCTRFIKIIKKNKKSPISINFFRKSIHNEFL